jgi:hypothetical protein
VSFAQPGTQDFSLVQVQVATTQIHVGPWLGHPKLTVAVPSGAMQKGGGFG